MRPSDHHRWFLDHFCHNFNQNIFPWESFPSYELREALLKITRRHLGIARIAFVSPLPAPNRALWGTSSLKKVPKTIRAGVQTPKNRANSSQKNCPKQSGQGMRTPPYGQCPNAFCANLNGASLSTLPFFCCFFCEGRGWQTNLHNIV